MRIMKINELKDSVAYRMACACGSNDHDWTLDIEYEEDINMVFLTVYSNQFYIGWLPENRISRILKRVKDAFKIIIGKNIQFQSSGILMDEPKQIEDLINALQEGLTKVREKVK